MTTTTRWWAMLLVAGFGCVQDEDGELANGDAGGARGTSAEGGTGPSSVAAFGGLDAGLDAGVDAGADAALPGTIQVSCGTAVCKNPLAMAANSLKLADPCCLDAPTARCGWVISDVCTPPPPREPRCPELTVPALLPTLSPMPAAPCCSSTGRCGAALPYVNLGCFETASFTSGDVGPMNCDGTPLAQADAGALR